MLKNIQAISQLLINQKSIKKWRKIQRKKRAAATFLIPPQTFRSEAKAPYTKKRKNIIAFNL